MLGFATPLTIGFIGSLHCLGMCGPLVLAYSLNLKKPDGASPCRHLGVGLPHCEGFRHHAAFHFGRLVAYGLLGALAAGFFKAADLSRLIFEIRGDMNLAGGILLIFFGVVLLKIMPLPSFFSRGMGAPWHLFGKWVPSLISSKGMISKAALGVCAGFLPCCLSWAMIVTAASTQNPLDGFITMVAFGLGTIPALSLIGVSSSFVSIRMRVLGERLAAALIMATGLMLVFRGVGFIA